MKLYVIILILFISVACQSKEPYSPDTYLSKQEQQQLLLSSVRYFGHLPKGGTHENKFNADFDEYYSKLVLDYTFERYFPLDGFEYFMVSRVAPSLKQKKVALAIRVKRDANGNIAFYEEVFRTWKFEVPEMLEKSKMLFDLLVTGGDLTPYYPQNSGVEEYIEFPDGRTFFDTEERRWKVISYSEPVDQSEISQN
jgi:hypothetical protein